MLTITRIQLKSVQQFQKIRFEATHRHKNAESQILQFVA